MIRVSQVLDYLTEPELLNWKLKHGKTKTDKVSKDAMYIGSRIDYMIQQDILGKSWDVGPVTQANHMEILNCVAAWTSFKNDPKYSWFVPSVKSMQEELVVGDLMGHYDFYCVRENDWGIVDLKCARSIWPKNWVQTAQYSEMKIPGAPAMPRFIGILRLDKTEGAFEYVEVRDQSFIERKVRSFNARLVLYKEAMEDREFFRQKLEEEVL